MSEKIRSVTVNVPAGMVAFNLEAAEHDEGPWRVVQAGLTAGEKTVTATARFTSRDRFYRLLWVADGGSTAGLLETDAIPLNSNDVTHKGSALA